MASTPISLPSWTQIEIGLTKVAAIAAAVEGTTNWGSTPVWLRTTLLSIAGAILTVNHYFNRKTTAVVDPTAPPAP